MQKDDVIYRQAAIDAVCLNNYHDITLVNGKPYTRGYHDGVLAKENDCIENIMNLPSAQPELCEDAVSRNAIIRTLNTMDRYVSEELTLCDTDEKYPKNEVFIVDDVYEEIVEKLPSAQPEPVTNCHDLTAAIEAIERIFDRCEEIEAHLPEGDPDRVGYKMYPDWLTVWKYLHQVLSAQPE